MAITPNQNTATINSAQHPVISQNLLNQQASESPFKRSPSPEPLMLPATTFSPPSNPKKSPLKRLLSLESSAGPEITISCASSPEGSEYGPFKRYTAPDTEIKLGHESTFRKPA
ncbi:hypothetical protein OIDMADRAFT_35466 [Oidiodendron maius Zn]|uniref:Uncharacterized protein n=1 Tax=Oidiodendron maius (strain Zn) TaxID=913774 RepID=A0A0C3GTE0_OIDMZ|nr:hypothetical protein OIDMADRAFT_35466 [Oidiodendron maius Zn]